MVPLQSKINPHYTPSPPDPHHTHTFPLLTSHIYLWRYDDKIIVSDIDGTIRK